MSNCLFWAVWQWLWRGGEIKSRPSRYGWWRHYLWQPPDGSPVQHYCPRYPKRWPLPPPLFRGYVKIGDK